MDKLNNMNKETNLSLVGFLLGVIGIVITIFPFLNENKFLGYLTNGIIAIILGIVGFILIKNVSKTLNDDMIKVGFVINPASIILGIISIVIYFIH